VGVDVIETGPAAMPGVQQSGKDPVIISAGLSLPLWWGTYDDSEEAALAMGAAHREDQRAAELRAEAELMAALSGVKDAQRQIELFRSTLIPQAETTLHSVLGSYQTGRSTVAAMLLAQMDLLQLQIDLARARARHAMSRASLEHVVGEELVFSRESNDAG
jgi:outer membrane protein TolC